MTETKNIEKNNFNFQKIKKLCEKVWKYIWKYLKKAWEFLKKYGIAKIIGFLVVLVSAILWFFETITLGLIHSDPERFRNILDYFYQFNLFEYVGVKEFYLIGSGGYLIDVTFYLIFIFLGLILWKKKNYFKRKYYSAFLIFLFGVGSLLFTVGFYKAMPEIMTPIQKIIQVEEKRGYVEERKDDGWKVEKRTFENGFEERGYLNRPNERGFYQRYYFDF